MKARNRQGDTNRRTPTLLSCPSHALKSPGTTRVFRLQGTNLGCPALYKDPLRGQRPAPLKKEGPRPRGGQRSGRMQGTLNPNPEVERREPVLDVKTTTREANRPAQMLAPVPSKVDLGCGRVPSCALKRSDLMKHDGFSKFIGHERGQNFTTEKSNRHCPQAQFCYLFPRPYWARNKRKVF